MWKSDGPLVQVAIGPGVGAAPSDQQLNAVVDAARTSLQASAITLPDALIAVDDRLAARSVMIYLGLAAQSAQVTSLDEVAPLLVEQVTAMATPALDLGGVQALLAEAAANVAAGDYSSALSQYRRAYYHSALNGYQAQATQALGDVAEIDPAIIQNMKVDDPGIIQNMKVDDPGVSPRT